MNKNGENLTVNLKRRGMRKILLRTPITDIRVCEKEKYEKYYKRGPSLSKQPGRFCGESSNKSASETGYAFAWSFTSTHWCTSMNEKFENMRADNAACQ